MISHVLIALLLQIGTVRIVGSWPAGACVASAWAVAREITQAEYRWIDAFGHGLRANMPWWAGVDYRVWLQTDPWLDWLVPCALTIGIAVLTATLADRGGANAVDGSG